MRRMKFTTFLAGGMVALATALPYAAQSTLESTINNKIRKEEADNSQVMKTLHYLADVYGPRVTGSPTHKAAAEWTVKTMGSWGMVNGKLERWDWNHPGWANEHLAVHAVSPFKDALVVEALAWTPGTNGTVKAKAFNLVVPDTDERVIEQDVRDAAVIVAGTLYQLAMQEQPLPRFAKDKMPPPPPAPRGGGGF